MLNRTLQVKMIKSNKDASTTPSQVDETYEGKAAIVGHYLERFINKAGRIVISYVVLDTLRQVLVAKANRP